MRIITDHPLASNSPDHRIPKGAINDNTHDPEFTAQVEQFFKRKINVLDLGCAGGGLVYDFLFSGNNAIGIEGSDIPLRMSLGEWDHLYLHNKLFTADISEPFILKDKGRICKFDLITAWEVLEHIPENKINILIMNIKRHLKKEGYFMASVAMFEDPPYHVTIKNKAWWLEMFKYYDLNEISIPINKFPRQGSFKLILKNG